MKVILTICSKDKNHSAELLPAFQRYTSLRIAEVKNTADKANLPFFILSGKYGLIHADENIEDYGHLLTNDEVKELSQLVVTQAKATNITAIDFYAKPNKGNWSPYYSVIDQVSKSSDIELKIILL